jgi:hypothetical protein
MSAPREVDLLLTGLLDNAIEIWRRDGMVATCSWAVGEGRSAFAQPFSEEGWTIPPEVRAGLHAMVAASVKAILIGRIDESWMREMPKDSTPLVHGDLADMADFDPEVKTAICVQCHDLRTAQSYLYMASLQLRDDGSEHWLRSYHDNPEGRIIGGSHLTARAIPILGERADLDPDTVEHFLNSLHWTMVTGGNDE